MRYVDKINRNTSAGFPWRSSKKFFMTYLPENEFHQNPIVFDDEILSRVDTRISLYLDQTQTHPVFTGALKDASPSARTH
jgi:hypothetical protein